MAIIYSYPEKTSTIGTDQVLISDSQDKKKTKYVTMQTIADYIDGEVTLQEVLNTGNTAASNAGNVSTILLQNASPSTTITLNGSNGEIATTGNISADGTLGVAGLSTLATVDINGGSIDGTIIGANVIADGFFDTMRCNTADINGGSIDGTIIGATTPAASTFTNMSASTVNIDGGTIDSTLIGSSFASEAKFATQGTNSAVQVVGNLSGAAALRVFQGPIQFGNTGGVGYGNVGDVIKSNGSAGTPEWISQETLAAGQVVQTVTNKSGGQLNYGDIVSIDPTAPNQPQPDVIKADNTTLLPAIGMVSDTSIANNTEGKITKIGLIPDIPSSQFVGATPVEGRIVYMAGGADAGKMTVDRPTGATTGIQNVGIITRVVGSNFDVQVVAIGRTNALPNNDANALFTTNTSNLPISTTGKLEVDIAGNSISIGDTAGATDITVTSSQFRAEVANNTAAGVNNFVIGSSALAQAFSNGGGGINNTALGVGAMSGNAAAGVMDAAYNVAVGQNTLASGTGLTNTVLFNTAVGYRAMAGTGAGPTTYNTAIGANALENINSQPAPTLGDLNTAIGSSALFNLSNGEENVAVGSSAGTGLTTGDYNTFVGVNSNSTNGIMQLATSIGYNADVLADGGVALGANAVVSGAAGVALGARAIAAANRLNIKVDNVAGPTPAGGLPQTPVTGPIPPAGLTSGDVYVITGVTLPGAPGPADILAIV